MRLIHRPDGDTDFRRTEIPHEGLALRRVASGSVEFVPFANANARDAAHVLPFVENEVRSAALVVAPGVCDLYVGGRRPFDVCVLAERAEIVLGTARVYFTAREPLTVARYEGDAPCGVCGEGVRGCDAITCTYCAAVTHAGALADGAERQCFEHRGSCPGCGLRTEDFEWMPDGGDSA
jgi:hypothetical protein